MLHDRARMDHAILFHARCVDGLAAAAVISQALWENGASWELFPAYHGTNVVLPTALYDHSHIVMVDFFSEAYFTPLMCRPNPPSLTIFDHHISNRSALSALQEENSDDISVLFDNEHCGASLAFSALFPDRPIPPVLSDIHDYDLHLSKRRNAEAIHYGLSLKTSAMPLRNAVRWMRSILFDDSNSGKYRELLVSGNLIKRDRDVLYDQIVQSVWTVPYSINGSTCRMGVLLGVSSDMITVLSARIFEQRDDLDLVVALYRLPHDQVMYGFRSRAGTGYALAAATQLGGGGHDNAAGAVVPFEDAWAPDLL